MVEREILLGCSGGLHLRPAGVISETAMRFRCHSELLIGDKSYNLRSVLSVLSAQMTCCKDVVLRCDGTDEEEAAICLSEILEESPDMVKEE